MWRLRISLAILRMVSGPFSNGMAYSISLKRTVRGLGNSSWLQRTLPGPDIELENIRCALRRAKGTNGNTSLIAVNMRASNAPLSPRSYKASADLGSGAGSDDSLSVLQTATSE